MTDILIPISLLDGTEPFDQLLVAPALYQKVKDGFQRGADPIAKRFGIDRFGGVDIITDRWMPKDRIAVMYRGQLVTMIEIQEDAA